MRGVIWRVYWRGSIWMVLGVTTRRIYVQWSTGGIYCSGIGVRWGVI